MTDEQMAVTHAVDILMVDDHLENLLALEALLAAPDRRLEQALSGSEALAATLKRDFALILLDVQMPDMDGFEVAELLRRKPRTRHIPIIFLTAISKDQRYVFQGYEVGAVDYLFKPLDPMVLKCKVDVFCRMYEQRRRLEDEVEARKQMEVALRESEERYRIITELTSDLVYWLRPDGSLRYVSPSASELTGYTTDELTANPSLLEEMIHPDDRELWRMHRESDGASRPRHLEFRINTREGEVRWISHTSRPIFGPDGAPIGIRASDRDISRLKAMEDELRRLTCTDALTGVANRRFLTDELDQEWRRAIRFGHPISIIMIDIDCFKIYNDTYGHQNGDTVLRKVALALAGCARRPRELVARYGGEEFIIILAQANEHDCGLVAQHALEAVRALDIPHNASPVEPIVTISAGAYTAFPHLNDDPSAAISAADKALYAAKHAGRNRIVVAADSLDDSFSVSSPA